MVIMVAEHAYSCESRWIYYIAFFFLQGVLSTTISSRLWHLLDYTSFPFRMLSYRYT